GSTRCALGCSDGCVGCERLRCHFLCERQVGSAKKRTEALTFHPGRAQPGHVIEPPLILPALNLIVVCLQDPAQTRAYGQHPGHRTNLLMKQGAKDQIEDGVAGIVADAIDQLASGATAPGQSGEIAISSVDYVPKQVQCEADCHGKWPSWLGIDDACAHDQEPSGYRDHVGGDGRVRQHHSETPRERVEYVEVQPVLQFPRPVRLPRWNPVRRLRSSRFARQRSSSAGSLPCSSSAAFITAHG